MMTSSTNIYSDPSGAIATDIRGHVSATSKVISFLYFGETAAFFYSPEQIEQVIGELQMLKAQMEEALKSIIPVDPPSNFISSEAKL